MSGWQPWVPGAILVVGIGLNTFLSDRSQTATPLRAPIEGVALTLSGSEGVASRFTESDEQAVGMTSYIYRRYAIGATADSFSLYVGYYDEQRQGKTIHSPKNCLPGGGWESVENHPTSFETVLGEVTVNRYRVVRKNESALVYYWYQGRGRVAHDEFAVKFQLLRDAALRGRTEEALVRIIVPVRNNDISVADQIAHETIAAIVADVQQVLPTF